MSLTALTSGLGLALLGLLGLWVLWRAVDLLRRRPRHNLSGRWVVVTGCDSGIGKGVVGALASRGVQVIACCQTPAGAQAAEAVGAAWTPAGV